MKTRIENWSAIVNGSDERYLVTLLSNTLKDANFTVLDYSSHQFENFGFTSLWLLGESHLALHTFPENNNAYIELSSCLEYKGDVFIEILKKELDFVVERKKEVIE